MRVDRSFASQPPACIATIRTEALKGGSWAGIGIDLSEEVRVRDICLEEVATWLKAERDARTSGAPGA